MKSNTKSKIYLFGISLLLPTWLFAQDSELRKLAPGVMREVNPVIQIEETFTEPRPVVELVHGPKELDWSPNYDAKVNTLLAKAETAVFYKSVWGLKLEFKTPRLIQVDGKDVWYFVYKVTNDGRHLNPVEGEDGTATNESVNHTVRFFPSFILESHEIGRAYMDKVYPKAFQKIAKREDKNRKFYNSVNISSVPIKVSTPEVDNGLWGIALWTDVDPRTDFFSINIGGLTNAYRWTDPAGAYREGDPPGKGRRFSFKTLKLNFWRPGDDEDLDELEFHYGVPTVGQLPPGRNEDEILKIYRLEKRVDHLWIYR